MTTLEHTPWYRQFWPWFLIALPGSVVVAGIVTVVIAVRSSDSVVSDHYYREGLAINRVMEQERRARDLQLEAVITFSQRQMTLRLEGELSSLPTTVLASFRHPLQAHKDFSVPLAHAGQRQFHGELPAPINDRWYLELTDLSDSWQLRGEVVQSGEGVFHFRAGAVDG